MYLTIDKKRLNFALNSSEPIIFKNIKDHLTWPKNRAFLNWGCSKVEILNDEELRLAVRMIAQDLYNQFSTLRGDFDEIEKKLESEPAVLVSDDEDLKSEDDMTQEDFYMMGYRHEIT